jgi:hypothetical protein
MIEPSYYLAASAYLDQGFRDRVLHEVEERSYRATVESFGLKMSLIVEHAKQARDLIAQRNIRLFFLLALAGGLYLFTRQPWFPVLLFVPACLVVLLSDARIRTEAIDMFREGESYAHPRYDGVDSDEQRNVVVYGGYVPFVGSGPFQRGWSFTVNLERRKDGGLPTAHDTHELGAGAGGFSVCDLYDVVGDAMLALGLRKLTCQDRLYVSGKDIRNRHEFLPDQFGPPVSQVDAAHIRRVMAEPSETVRCYKRIEVIGWSGHIVLSTYIRLVQTGTNLFVECAYYLIPPLNARYRHVEELVKPQEFGDDVGRWWGRCLATLVVWPVGGVTAVFDLLQPVLRYRRRAEVRKAIERDPWFDYGVTISLREAVAVNQYSHYFQSIDRDMLIKMIERQLLDSIINFLDRHGIYTSDLRQRQMVILNNGLIMSGGTLKAESVAVGEGSQAVSAPAGEQAVTV